MVNTTQLREISDQLSRTVGLQLINALYQNNSRGNSNEVIKKAGRGHDYKGMGCAFL